MRSYLTAVIGGAVVHNSSGMYRAVQPPCSSQFSYSADVAAAVDSRDCNHEYAGASVSAPNLPAGVQNGGFMITKTRKQVGSGQEVYNAAVAAVKNWSHIQLGEPMKRRPRLAVSACPQQ
jgi:hypothetical protein